MRAGRLPILLAGLAAGLLSGLLGIGGGLVMGPALILQGLPLRRATGTALAVVPAAALVAVATEYGLVATNHDLLLALLLAAGGPLGVLLGRRVLSQLSGDGLRWAFLLLLLVAAGRSLGLFGEAASDPQPGLIGDSGILFHLGTVALGAMAGVSSILFGIGGGVVMVPGLVYLVGGILFPQAAAISLMAMVPTSLFSLRVAWRDGRVEAGLLPPLFLGALPMAALGVWARNDLFQPQGLSYLFGAFLLLVAWRMRKPAVG